MFKTIIIIFLVVAALVGGLLVLRSSGRVGLPDEEVLRRAGKRARDQEAVDEKEDERK